MELTTRHAELPPVFVVVSKQTTLAAYDTWNRSFVLDAKHNGVARSDSFPQFQLLDN